MVTKYEVQIIDISICNAMNIAISNLMKCECNVFITLPVYLSPDTVSWAVTSKCRVL